VSVSSIPTWSFKYETQAVSVIQPSPLKMSVSSSNSEYDESQVVVVMDAP